MPIYFFSYMSAILSLRFIISFVIFFCLYYLFFFFFFFSSRRRHTRWPRDWSSDVCSSDLSFVPTAIISFCSSSTTFSSISLRFTSLPFSYVTSYVLTTVPSLPSCFVSVLDRKSVV